ncbi:MAG: Hsp20 family protein [Pelagibacteraceae bacterium]
MGNLEKLFLGFDNFPFADTAYPRYNIGKLDDGYLIEIAVPGANQGNLEVDVHNGVLRIKRTKREEESVSWVHKGISGKAFEKQFKLDTNLEVESCKLKDGMLSIHLQYAEAARPAFIPVEYHG